MNARAPWCVSFFALLNGCFSGTNGLDAAIGADVSSFEDAPEMHSDAIDLDPDAGFEDAAAEDAAASPCGRAWCWESPLPQGNTLQSISGSSTTSVFAVGDNGTAVHFDGTTWRRTDTGTTARLNDVAAIGPLAYAVGENGVVLRWSGESWSIDPRFTPVDLSAVWADIFGRVWVVGENGVIFHFFEASWLPVTGPTGADLTDIAGLGQGELWTTGGNVVQRWDGQRWSIIHQSKGPVTCVAVRGPNDVWAGGDPMLHYDGRNWTEYPLPPFAGAPLSIDARENGDVFAQVPLFLPGGAAFVTIFFDGTRWQFWTPATTSEARTLDLIGGEAWFAGELGTLIRWNGRSTVDQRGGGEDRRDYHRHWASPSGVLWAAGEFRGNAAIATYRARNWLHSTLTGGVLTAIWGLHDDSIWTASDDEYFHYDGTRWTPYGQPSAEVRAIFGFNEYEVWSAGLQGSLQRWDGTEWSPVESGTDRNLYALWGPDPSQLFAVGEAGTILQWDRSRWTASASTVTVDLYAVHGTSRGDIWAAGAGGTIARWNGTSWRIQPRVTDADLHAVYAVSPINVIFAGKNGTIVTWDGVKLSLEEKTAARDLTYVLPVGGRAWVGAGLSILRGKY